MEVAQMTADKAQVKLRPEVLGQCARDARREGIFAGVASGAFGGIFGQRVFRFNRNTSMLCGILTGVLSGYFFTQAFLSSRISEAMARQTLIGRQATSSELIVDETPAPTAG